MEEYGMPPMVHSQGSRLKWLDILGVQVGGVGTSGEEGVPVGAAAIAGGN